MNSKSDDELDKSKSDVALQCPILAPFPKKLLPSQKMVPNLDILEIFKQVKINILLLDAIKNISSYAKFLKDLCTIKRKLNVQKKTFLKEQVIEIIQHNTPPKYKDLGCPTIFCIFGNFRIKKALLNIGASVNLLPYSVYEQLGLGELKPTTITLQFVDRSVKILRGVVKDVLVQVNKFYFPIDFIVLDTQPMLNACTQIPIILGHPFLVTSNALINCRNGVMKLSFGNMTLELNIFNICKQHGDVDDVHEVNFVETVMQDQFFPSLFFDPLKACLAPLNKDSVISSINSLLESTPLLNTDKGITHFEEFPPRDIIQKKKKIDMVDV